MVKELKTTLPIYQASINWQEFFAEYPAPDVWSQTMRMWSPDRIRALQEKRFQRIVDVGWQNPFYRRRWQAAGLKPGDVRTLDDIVKLPTYNSDDVKKDQLEHAPFGDFHGITSDTRRRVPLKI